MPQARFHMTTFAIKSNVVMWNRARGDTASRRNYGLTFSLPLPPCRKAYRYRLAASGNYKQPWPWLFVEAAESDSIVSGSSSGGANVLSAFVTAVARIRRASSSVMLPSKPWLRAIAFALCGTTSCKTKLGPIQTMFQFKNRSPKINFVFDTISLVFYAGIALVSLLPLSITFSIPSASLGASDVGPCGHP